MDEVNKIIEDNIGLVWKQLHKFNRADDDNAFSYALEALGVAAQTYDKTKGYAFSTYASTCIYNAVGCYLRSLNKQKQISVVYYDDFIEGSDKLTYLDVLPDTETPDKATLDRESKEQLWAAFEKVLSTMSDKASVSIIRYWQQSEFTAKQAEIAEHVNVSQSHVSRTLSAFKHKLKQELEDYLC